MDIVESLREKKVDQAISKAWRAGIVGSQLNTDNIDTILRAMDTQESGGGAEFVPTGFSQELINQFRQNLRVSPVFRHIAMPTPIYKLPVEGNPATAYLVPENTADTGQTSITASQPGTAGVTFTAVSIGAATRVSKELTQDSIVPLVPMIQSNLLRGLGNGLESALINGDTTNTHQDSDTTGATDVRKAFKGLRKLALANGYSVDFSGSVSLANVRKLRTKMGMYGIDPSQLVLLVGNSGYIQLLSLAEVVTVDKYGPSATVLTGEIGKIDGISIVVTPYMREDLNASGVFDNTTKTKTAMIMVNRSAFLVGDRQTIELDQTDEPKVYRQNTILADMRVDFQSAFAIASNPTVAIGYNIAS
jgi:hypothetical protein